MAEYGRDLIDNGRPKSVGFFMAYKNFWLKSFDIDGTTGRKEYFFAILAQTIASLAIVGVLFTACYWMTGGMLNDRTLMPAGAVEFFALFWVIPSFLPMFCLIARRLRDSGIPAGVVLLSLLPYVGYLLMTLLFFVPSKSR